MFFKALIDLIPFGEDVELPGPIYELEPQVPIGIYVVDFRFGDCVVEIDGHEFHKTKEQRERDYKKQRYLTKRGYTVIRFMGTEVFLDAKSCALEMVEIAGVVDEHDMKQFYKGLARGKEYARQQRGGVGG